MKESKVLQDLSACTISYKKKKHVNVIADFISLDIKAFVRFLRAYPRSTLHEVLVKYGISPLTKLLQGWHRLPSWLELFKLVLRRDSFILIVLDACRYDLFSLIYKKYFHGRLIAVRSPGAHTYGWLPKAFFDPEFKDIRVFYAKLAINTHDVKLEEFMPTNRGIEVIKIRPRKKSDLRTVSPWEVNNEVLKRGLSKRNIIWYMQPHYPWIRHKELSLKLINEVTWQDFTPKDLVKEALKRKGISRQEVIKAYLANLIEVLRASSALIKEVQGYVDEIIITSDHGELLGEYGLYLHPHYELPQLCIVPWLEVEEVT
ncbi:MAG: hypothetical protein QXK88_09100 [Desulfurococcaceae archaeon]